MRIYNTRNKSEYAWILGFITLVDLLYALVKGFLMSNALATSIYYYVLLENPLLLNSPPLLTKSLVALDSFETCLMSSTNALHFWYRSDILSQVGTWSKKRFLATYLISLSYYLGQFPLMWFSTEDATKESFLDIKKAYGSEVAHVVYTNSTKTILLLRTLLHKGPIVVFYIMLTYFGVKIVRAMTNASAVSSTAKAQRHVVRVIILQAIYPAILNVLPIFLVAFLNLFGINSPLAPYFAAASFQLMPILNTLTIVFLIPTYRRAAISTIRPTTSTTTNTVEIISSRADSG